MDYDGQSMAALLVTVVYTFLCLGAGLISEAATNSVAENTQQLFRCELLLPIFSALSASHAG